MIQLFFSADMFFNYGFCVAPGTNGICIVPFSFNIHDEYIWVTIFVVVRRYIRFLANAHIPLVA